MFQNLKSVAATASVDAGNRHTEPRVVNVTFSKINNSLGLSIVAAKVCYCVPENSVTPAVGWAKVCLAALICFELIYQCQSITILCHPIDHSWAMMAVWRMRWKIIKTVQCCIVYDSVCVQWYAHTHTHTYEQFLQLTVGLGLHTTKGCGQMVAILFSNIHILAA